MIDREQFIKIGERAVVSRGKTITITLPRHSAKPGEEYIILKDLEGNILLEKKEKE